MKTIIKVIAFTVTSAFAASAYAVPTATNTWTVSDAAGNCNGGPHGLWTNTLRHGPSTTSCRQYYSFQAGSTLTQYDDGTAVLNATALNPANVLATINITFGGFADTYSPNKTGGTGVQSDWDYYTTIDANSKINILGTDYFVGVHDVGMDGNTANDYVFQIGTGANDKTSDFGGSSWLDIFSAAGAPLYNGGSHWDLNMDFTARAPAPAIVLLLGTGLVAFGFSARRRA